MIDLFEFENSNYEKMKDLMLLIVSFSMSTIPEFGEI